MAEYLIQGETLDNIANAINAKTGGSAAMTPALWTEASPKGVIPVWRQPTGAQDVYQTGDRVHYPDEHSPVYESAIDGNVWSPEAYPAGWRQVDG